MDLESVALTNDHAALSKISAERCGYFPDGAYSSKLFYGNLKARAPLINIGYTIRVRMIRHYISKALSGIFSNTKVCIFSIGAGFDNTYHWLRDSFPQMNFEFYEIDTDIVLKRKAEMLAKFYGYSVSKSETYYAINDNYKLIHFDLNQIDAFGGLLESFAKTSCLNIWISECVLCYLEQEAADRVLKFAASVPNSYFILYEQLISKPFDPFTKCMLAHFVKSNSPLLSPITVDGLKEQTKRFLGCGFKSTKVTFMSEFFYGICSEEEAKSILDVQLFDEREELDLFLSHYAVMFANNFKCSLQVPPTNSQLKDDSYVIPILPESSHKAGKINLPKYSAVCKFSNCTIVTGGRESLCKVPPKIAVYDKFDDVVTVAEHSSFARYRHACLIHQNLLFLIGGVSSSGNLVVVNTENWEPILSLDLPTLNRINHAAVSFGEWIYVIGGVDRVKKRPVPHSRFKLANEDIIVEEVLQSLPSLCYHVALSLSNERILIVGGLLGQENFESNDAIVINPQTETISYMKLENREALMLLGADNILIDDDLKLFGLGRKRTVCFSMGSHCDSSWNLDFSHLHFPSVVPIVSDFNLSSATPYVIRGLEVFDLFCQRINSEALDSMGSRRISVHKCTTPKLKFYPEKNFVFETKEFKDVIKCMEEDKDHWYYFRALSEENARKYRADFWHDFPEISKHLNKATIPIPEDRWHSSILRMSSPRGLCLWTHYDVMSNFLIQIRGRKKVTLWPPSDLPYLYIQGSSSIADMDDFANYPNLLKASPVEVMLGPGDVLFIPALWFHHVETLGEEWSLALNVFWRDLPSDCYPKKDLYGNADPNLDPHLLPQPFKSFYLTKRQTSNY